MTRLGRQIRSTVSKSNILQSLNYRGGFAPPTSRCRDFSISSGPLDKKNHMDSPITNIFHIWDLSQQYIFIKAWD